MESEDRAKKYRSRKVYREIRDNMLDSLETRGMLGAHYTDKVDEYMRLWCHLQMLQDDIDERGVFVYYSNGATQKGTTENKSLAAEVRVSGQMLSIWNALGFKADAVEQQNGGISRGGEEDDDL